MNRDVISSHPCSPCMAFMRGWLCVHSLMTLAPLLAALPVGRVFTSARSHPGEATRSKSAFVPGKSPPLSDRGRRDLQSAASTRAYTLRRGPRKTYSLVRRCEQPRPLACLAKHTSPCHAFALRCVAAGGACSGAASQGRVASFTGRWQAPPIVPWLSREWHGGCQGGTAVRWHAGQHHLRTPHTAQCHVWLRCRQPRQHC